MIKNLGTLINQLKQKLPEYLESQGINTSRRLFVCPNKKEHKHDDAKPSANFFPDKTSWHCFACSFKTKLGDIFDAVHVLEGKDITGYNFFEVVKYLCKKFNIPYQEESTQEDLFFKEVRTYLAQVVDVAHTNLLKEMTSNKQLRLLLDSKQWTQSVKTFKLGFLSKPFLSRVSKDVLTYLNIKDPSILVGRLIIPIYDINSNIVGLTTRALSLNKSLGISRYMHFISKPIKYLLFNVNNIDPSKEVLIVEGPSSVITLNSYNINNAVATFGNLLHESQYNLLVRKKVSKVKFLYDGDAGGSEGLRNSLKHLSRGDLEVTIGELPDSFDPGDYVIKHRTLNVKSIPLYNYLLDNYSSNQNDKYIEKCLMVYINSVKDIVRKEKLINEVSKKVKINKSTVIDLINIYAKDFGVSATELLKEREALLTSLNEFETWSWSRGRLLGLKSFDILDKRLDGIQNGLILIGGKPNIGKCLIGGTLIYTSDGIVPIDDYFTNIKKKGFHPVKNLNVNNILTHSNVSHLYFDKSDTVTITLKNGMELTGTPEHQIVVRKDNQNIFTPLKNLKNGDKVLVTLGLNHWGNQLHINYSPKIETRYKCKYKLKKVPSTWTYDLAYLTGFYIGDGCCTRKDFVITVCRSNASNILHLIKKLFGIAGTYKRGNVSAGRSVRRFFKHLGVNKNNAYRKTIPLSILKAPLPIVLGFINGLIASDGYVNKKCKYISFDFVSESLSKRLQTLFINMGINCSLRSHIVYATNTKLKRRIKSWRLVIYFKGFNKYVKLLKKYNLPIPTKIRKSGIVFRAYSDCENISLVEVPITSIRRNKKFVKVYDVTVPKTHYFIANNIINHNSAMTISLGIKMLQRNENLYLLYFTLDDSMYVTLARFIANLSRLPINVVSNPNFKITKAELPDHIKKDYINRREKAMEFLRNNATIINIKDSSDGATIEAIRDKIKTVKPLTLGKQLVIMIDSVHNIKSEKFVSEKHLYSLISNELNDTANEYKCPVIVSAHSTKEAIKNKNFDGTALKETVEFFYDAKLIMFIDADNDILEGSRDDVDVSVIVSKNKFSGFKGIIPMKFYRSLSLIKEITESKESQDLFE